MALTGHVPTVDQLVEVIDHEKCDLRSGLELQHADACTKKCVLQAVRASEVGSSGKHRFEHRQCEAAPSSRACQIRVPADPLEREPPVERERPGVLVLDLEPELPGAAGQTHDASAPSIARAIPRRRASSRTPRHESPSHPGDSVPSAVATTRPSLRSTANVRGRDTRSSTPGRRPTRHRHAATRRATPRSTPPTARRRARPADRRPQSAAVPRAPSTGCSTIPPARRADPRARRPRTPPAAWKQTAAPAPGTPPRSARPQPRAQPWDPRAAAPSSHAG